MKLTPLEFFKQVKKDNYRCDFLTCEICPLNKDFMCCSLDVITDLYLEQHAENEVLKKKLEVAKQALGVLSQENYIKFFGVNGIDVFAKNKLVEIEGIK